MLFRDAPRPKRTDSDWVYRYHRTEQGTVPVVRVCVAGSSVQACSFIEDLMGAQQRAMVSRKHVRVHVQFKAHTFPFHRLCSAIHAMLADFLAFERNVHTTDIYKRVRVYQEKGIPRIQRGSTKAR